MLIVTYIRCCKDSKISAGIVDILVHVDLMPQSNIHLLLIYSWFVLDIGLAFTLSVWSLYLSCNLSSFTLSSSCV